VWRMRRVVIAGSPKLRRLRRSIIPPDRRDLVGPARSLPPRSQKCCCAQSSNFTSAGWCAEAGVDRTASCVFVVINNEAVEVSAFLRFPSAVGRIP